MENKTIVFALTSSVQVAEEIIQQLDIPLGACDVKHFADGEIMIDINESVRGKNVYIVQSTCNPVSDNLMEILIALDACKRASAAKITVVMPYFGYARQDRKARPRQPITSKLVADLLEKAGANRVITMELHASQIQGFFNIPTDDISSIGIIGDYLSVQNLQDIVVVSPDHGGVTRARKLAEILQAPIAIIDKRRPKPNVAEAMNLIGEVEGKTAILIDDIVDTAGTLVSAIDMLYKNNAKEVYACCVHGVLSDPAIERLKASNLKEFVCTNTIDQTTKQKQYEQMKVLSVGQALGQVIDAIEKSTPVSKVVAKFGKGIK